MIKLLVNIWHNVQFLHVLLEYQISFWLLIEVWIFQFWWNFHLMFLVASCWSEMHDWTFARFGIKNIKVSLCNWLRYMKHRWHHSWASSQFPDKSCGTYPGSECLWSAKCSFLPVLSLWIWNWQRLKKS